MGSKVEACQKTKQNASAQQKEKKLTRKSRKVLNNLRCIECKVEDKIFLPELEVRHIEKLWIDWIALTPQIISPIIKKMH